MSTQPQREDRPIVIELIRGVEGYCVAINSTRVAGPKPWGGGNVILELRTTKRRILDSLPDEVSPDERERVRLVFLAGFLHGLSVTHRFAFDGNERDCLRQAGRALARMAEAGR